MPPPRHPNKEIRVSVEYATEKGWRVEKASARAHNWGTMFCPHGHPECVIFIRSTPRNPEGEARRLRRAVDKCPGPKKKR